MRSLRIFLIMSITALAITLNIRADELFLNCYECSNPPFAQYDGGPTPFYYGAAFDYMIWSTPSNPVGTYWASGGLQIQTGDLIGSSANTWDFGSGGSFTLTGSIGGSGGIVAPDSTLLSGSILSTSFYGGGYSLGGGELQLEISATANEQALALLGLPDTQYVGWLYLDLTNVFGAGGWFSPAVPPGPFTGGYTHDFQAELEPVPEPTSFFMLSTVVLLTLSFRARRWRRH